MRMGHIEGEVGYSGPISLNLRQPSVMELGCDG